MTRKEILADLNNRQISADSRRIPGGIIDKSREIQGAWWNGFYWGLEIAIEKLEKLKGK